MERLCELLDRLIDASGERVSALVQTVGGDRVLYARDEAKQVPSASLIKLPLLLCALQEVTEGKLSLQDQLLLQEKDILPDTVAYETGAGTYSLEELLSWMIIRSDNTAANAVIRLLGFDAVNRYCTETLHTENTRLERCMLDAKAVEAGRDNYTSQTDMANICRRLYGGTLLDRELSGFATDLLLRQRRQELLLRYWYAPIRFAHKTGELAHLRQDSGVLYTEKGLYYVGVSVYDSVSEKGNPQLCGTLGKAIFQTLLS